MVFDASKHEGQTRETTGMKTGSSEASAPALTQTQGSTGKKKFDSEPSFVPPGPLGKREQLETRPNSLPVKGPRTPTPRPLTSRFTHTHTQECSVPVKQNENPSKMFAKPIQWPGAEIVPSHTPSPALAPGAFVNCQQLEPQLASLERRLQTEIRTNYEKIDAKFKRIEGRINFERARAEVRQEKQECVTRNRVDELLAAMQGEVASCVELAMRQHAEMAQELKSQWQAALAKSDMQDDVQALREKFREFEEWQKVDKDELKELKGSLKTMAEMQRMSSQEWPKAIEQSLQDHTGRLAAIELEARRSKEDVGALQEHVRQASATRQADVAGLRDEQGARLDALDLAMQQQVEMAEGLKSQWQAALAKSGVQDEVQALGEKFRDLEEWQKVDKEELKGLKGSLNRMAETQWKAVEQSLQDHTGRLAAIELEARRSKEDVGALQEHVRQASATRQADVAGLRDEQGARLDALDLAMQQQVEMAEGLKSQWQAALAKSGVQDEVQALGKKFRDLEEWQRVDKEELNGLKGSLNRMAETQWKDT